MTSSYEMAPTPVFATDLDGTLIPLNGNTANLLDLNLIRRELASRKIEVVFVTGRHLDSVVDAIDQHHLPVPEWVMTDVGTTIYRRQDNGYRILDEYQCHLRQITLAMPIDELRSRFESLPGLRLQEPHKQGRFKLSFYADRHVLPELVQQIELQLNKLSAPYGVIHSLDPFHGGGLIDLLPAAVSKAYALDWWSESVNLKREQLVFAGDSGNDLAALTAGYRAIVVGNADRTLAQQVHAAHQAQGWCDRLFLATSPASSGVLEGLNWFGLIGPLNSTH
jgi:maltooligosyltrehalose trehalohydrolase